MVEISWNSIGQTFKDLSINYEPKGTIENGAVKAILEDRFPKLTRGIYVMEPVYNLFSKEQYDKFFRYDQTDKNIYGGRRKCKWFTRKTLLNMMLKMEDACAGSFYTFSHDLIVYITDKYDVVTREPQTDAYDQVTSEEHIEI